MALPSVLAGPVVRRVDAASATVWIALSKPGKVKVVVFRGRAKSTGAGTADMPAVGDAEVEARRCGTNLFVAAVRVPIAGLPPLTRHSYDVVVDVGAGAQGLKALDKLKVDTTTSPNGLPLGYGTDMLPGFVTQAVELADVRIVHTSCRRSNGPGAEALGWLDDRIQAGLSDLRIAPQQLFLTGDQIYADEVGGVLLPMLSELGREIVGPEKLPVDGTPGVEVDTTHFPALRRQDAVRALGNFTSTSATSHLLSYGEFVAMYCAAWSPTVWRTLPSADSLFQPPPADAAVTKVTDWEAKYGDTQKWKDERLEAYTEEAERVAAWRDAVPKVARVLANVPTYMIFDDHEVTDDWNISPRWRSRVTNSDVGRAVLRNALLAYTVFQAWGNDPEKFSHDVVLDGNGNPVPVNPAQLDKNELLLDQLTELSGVLATPTAALLDKVDTSLGLASATAVPDATFHYEVPGSAYTVRVLDTRTRRTFAGSGNAPAKLVGASLDSQLPAGPFQDTTRKLLVVVSPVPVLFPRIFEQVGQPGAAFAFDLQTHIRGKEKAEPGKLTGLLGSEHKDIEGWRADEGHHEQLLRRLGTYRRVVVLSGDIHFANTLVMDYWGKDDEVADSRIVQCTASASRNQPGEDMRGLLRTLRIGQQLLQGLPCERIGWDGDHGVVLPPGASIKPGRRARLMRKPAILPAQGWPAGTTVNKVPDWRWRVEVLRDDRAHTALPAGAPDIPVLTWVTSPGDDKLPKYADIVAKHAQVAAAPRDPVRLMVFRNNIGLVSLAVDGSDVRVSHTLLSNAADGETGDAFTEHTVSFAPAQAPAAPVLRTD